MQGPHDCGVGVSRKRFGNVWLSIGSMEGLDASNVNSGRAKRSRAASDSQIAACISRSEYSGIPMFPPSYAIRCGAASGQMASAQDANHRSAGVKHSDESNKKIPNHAALETFRPFLQQLAAGIVAGFAATTAQQCTAACADAAAAAAHRMSNSVIAADDGCRTGPQGPSLLPQPIMQQLMLMMAKAVALHPASSHNELPRAPDAVVMVSRKGLGKQSTKQGGEVAVARGIKAAAAAEGHVAVANTLCCSALQGVNAAVPPADVPDSAVAVAAGQLISAGPAELGEGQVMMTHSSSPQMHQAPARPHISSIALDLRDSQSQQQNSNSAKPAPTLGTNTAIAATTGTAAARVSRYQTPAAPLPGNVPARNSRGSSGIVMTAAPNAADVQKINSIRQHVMLLEASLGNMSPQVASAYLFLADVLDHEGSQWSIHHAARARARAMDIIGTAGQQQVAQSAVQIVGRRQTMMAVGQW